jgi:hypothetical protein
LLRFDAANRRNVAERRRFSTLTPDADDFAAAAGNLSQAAIPAPAARSMSIASP